MCLQNEISAGARAPRLGAQSALYVEHHKRLTLVRKASGERPYVRENGAVVRLRIAPDGAVAGPVVVSASDPAFGESALAALRQWRFVPQIKGGQAVAAAVELPFDFAP